MKQLLILLFALLSLASYGQGDKPIQMNFGIYRGNTGVSPVIYLSPADTLKPIAVSARPQVGSGLTNPQPTWVRSGLALTIRFATSTTLPELVEYQLTVDNQVRVKGVITTNRDQVIIAPTIPATVLSGIYSQLGVLQGLINNIGAGEVTLSAFNSFTNTVTASLATQASDIAGRVTLSAYNVDKSNMMLSIGQRALQSSLDATNTVVAGKLTQAQADLLYKPVGYVPSWSEILGKPGLFPPTSHTHVAADIMTDATRRFVTDAQISGWNSLSGSGFSGNYNDLTNRPTLSTVAGSGSYLDLLNRPALFSGNYGDLSGKPSLFSGSYLDLTNKPTIPTSASQVGAVALSDYNNDKTAQGTLDVNQNTNITALQSGKLDLTTYNTNRSADQLATSTAQNTANTALSTANSATATGVSNSNAITTNKASADAHIANTNNPHGTTAAQVGAVATGTYTADKSAQGTLDATQNTAITLASPRSFTSYAAANAASTTATTAQTWVVTADETVLVNGVPQRQTYWFDGSKLLVPTLFPADGSPGTPSYNNLADRVSALEAVPLSTSSAFTIQIPFTSYYNDLGTISFSQNRLTASGTATYVSSATLTPNTTNARPGATSLVRVIANGTTPTLSAFKLTTGSQNFVPTSGTTNILGFFYDGLSYWLTMFQETGATPLDIIAPTLVSASIADNNRTQLVLTYNEALDTGAGLGASDFTISGKTISSLAVSGSAITATVSAPFVYSDVVTITGGSGKIRDAALNISGNLSSQAVTNNITNLILASASVADAARNQVVFTYNKTVDNTSLPATSAYSFSPTKTVSSVSSSGNSVTVTVGSPFALGDVITATYTKPGTNFLKDLYGSFWATGTYNVTNNIVAPVLTSATINRGSNSRIAVLANKAITLGSTVAGDFSVPGSTISGISVSGSTLNIDVSAPFSGTATPTVNYTSGAGKLQDQYGSLFASVTSLSVTNNVQTWVPVTWSTTSLSVASGIWSPTTNVGTTNFGQTGVTTTKLAAGNDGGIRQVHNTTDSYFSAIGLKTASTLGGYQTFTYGAYVSSGGTLSRIDNGTVTTVGGGLIAANERLMINRIGTVVKIQKLGTDGVTITDLYTFAASSSTDLYGAVDVRGDGKNNTPQSDNLK